MHSDTIHQMQSGAHSIASPRIAKQKSAKRPAGMNQMIVGVHLLGLRPGELIAKRIDSSMSTSVERGMKSINGKAITCANALTRASRPIRLHR
jgi:hypothetical protein